MMANPALRWIRTLTNASSWRPRHETPPLGTPSGVQRLSLIPETADEEPRFPDEEREARFSQSDILVPRPRERRNSDRTPFIADLKFGEDVELFTGLSLDISEGGLFVATYTEIPIGTRLVLCFELPDGSVVEARGEVRWTRKQSSDSERPGIGIAFTELPSAAREQIVALCARQPPLYFEL
jgi:uncharacterized protein (TIGR02266 family)